MRKTIKSWNGNPETEPDYKSEVKAFSIIADVNNSKSKAIFDAVSKIIELSESYYLEDISFDKEGCTIYANIKIEDSPYCYSGNFDKLKSYFGNIGDIFCKPNH